MMDSAGPISIIIRGSISPPGFPSHTEVSMSYKITAPFILSGMFGGIIANLFGYNTLFTMSILFSIITFLWLMIKVVEPRRILQPVQSN